jgi:uncharacterized protein YhfF
VVERSIGSDADMVKLILGVISSGEKSMTFSLPWLAGQAGHAPPQVGQLLVALDAGGEPALLMRLTEVKPMRFGQVSAADLAREGIPMRDPVAWRALHTTVWNHKLAPLGLHVSDDMPVWAEYFDLLQPPGQN